jgi:two-component system, NtrC family, sensor kinase
MSVVILHVLQGPDRGKQYQLPTHEPQLIGRSSEALPITDHTMSRRHAELTPDDGRWFIGDLKSANGTFVNGERINGRVQLAAGDQIRCGSTLMVFALKQEERESPIRVLGPDEMDATIEQTLRADETMHGHEAAADHLKVIYQLTAITASAVKRDELLKRVMDLIFAQFKPERGFILLSNEPGGRLDPVVVRYKVKPATLQEGHIPVSRTIVQHTLQKGEGVLATNAMNDARFRSGDSVREYGIRSAICVPVRTAERIHGVIHIDSSLVDFTYSEAQLRLLTAIGQHAGLALQSAELVASMMQTERLAAMGETVAALSHSIKNILQGLRGGADAVEMALHRGDLKLAAEGWPILSRNLDRIFSLTLNMLAWSKERSLDLEMTLVPTVIRDAVELMQPQCDRRRVGLIVDLDDAIPPIPADPNALHQALMNLLANAAEAAPEKSGVITVRARYLTEGAVEVQVSDNGSGVPAEFRDRIFDPFVSTKGQRGTGLGLAVARKIIRQHGGDISLTSAPGAGATFTFSLPIEHSATDNSQTGLPRAAAPGTIDDDF